MSTNNWRTPPSEKLRALRVRLRVLGENIRAEHPGISDADAAKMAKAAMPGIYDEGKALGEEMLTQAIEEEIDQTCFVYGPDNKIVRDEDLRRMTDRELAAWAGRENVMFAQAKAHLAQRFPETNLKVISGGREP